MLVATQIVPLINLVSIATVLLVVLVTRLHLHFVSLGIGMLWRLAVSSVISLAPILMLAHLEVRFFERTRPVFFAFFLVFLAVCWLIPILGSRKSIRRWLIAKQNHSWAIATAFIAFFGAYFSCWAYCLPDDGLVSMAYSFRETRGLLLLLLPMLIAERSIYVPRLAVSRVGKTVASVTVIGLIGLVVKDYRFIAEWKSNHLLPPQLWREFGVVQNLSWWVIVGSAMIFPSRFIVPYSALGFCFAFRGYYRSETEAQQFGINCGIAAVLAWALMFFYRRCVQTPQEVPAGGLPPAT